MSKKMTKEGMIANRLAIVELLNKGLSVRKIAEELGTSGATIVKVKKLLDDPNGGELITQDKRESNHRPEQFDEDVLKAIMQLREDTQYGPQMLWAMIQRDPEKYGMTIANIPSPATIGRWLAEKGVTRTNVGTRDNREYPADAINLVGMLAIDGHGPIHWKDGSGKQHEFYTITVIDQFTRLALSIVNDKDKAKSGTQHWLYGYQMAIKHLLGGAIPESVQMDNGIGVVPVNGWTTTAMRYMMKQGVRITYTPPRMPWKNGRVERFHRTLEEEYFDLARLDQQRRKEKGVALLTADELIEGYIGWVNFYNMGRPHTGLELRDKDGNVKVRDGKPMRNKTLAPAEIYPLYSPVKVEDVVNIQPVYENIGAQAGIIDAIRLVRNDGTIQLWGEDWFKINSLKGNFVRVRFILEPNSGEQFGQIIWQEGRGKEPLVVGSFNHHMDRKHSQKNLVENIKLERFEDIGITPPPLQTITRSKNGEKTGTDIKEENRVQHLSIESLRKTRNLLRDIESRFFIMLEQLGETELEREIIRKTIETWLNLIN
jgi:transposase InsO family protein/transposase